jgi:hypothetical protein
VGDLPIGGHCSRNHAVLILPGVAQGGAAARSLRLTPAFVPPPAVQASIAANTYVVSGPSQTKNVAGARISRITGARRRLGHCRQPLGL